MPRCSKIEDREECKKPKAKVEAKEEAQSEKAQVGGTKTTEKRGVDENAIRKQTIKEWHDEIDKQVARRICRFRDAAMRKFTTSHMGLGSSIW